MPAYRGGRCPVRTRWLAKSRTAEGDCPDGTTPTGIRFARSRTRSQEICDSFGAEHIDALLRKWLQILPNPFTPQDEVAGYRYRLWAVYSHVNKPEPVGRCPLRRQVQRGQEPSLGVWRRRQRRLSGEVRLGR